MEEQAKKDKSRLSRKLLQFSGIGFQMLVTILLFAYGGMKLEEYYAASNFPWTMVMTLSGLVIALYFMIKGLLNIIR